MAELPGQRQFGAVIKGVDRLEAELTAIQKRTDRATYAAVKRVQTVAKASVKSGMRGRPRWDQRGKRHYQGAGVNLHLNPHHVAKSGGPGSLTGHLRSAVGGMRRPKVEGHKVRGGVGVGGPESYTNRYRKEVDSRYPFMKPGVKKAEPKFPKVWETAWAKATQTKK